MKDYIFTKKGFNDLQEFISTIKKNLDIVIKDKAESGSGQDTWHDEGFKRALVEEMMWNNKLLELKQIAQFAQVINPKEQNEYIDIGNGVLIEYEDGRRFKFILEGYILGEINNYVSVYSPVGQVIQGTHKGEKKDLRIREQNKTIKILDIFLPSIAENIVFNKQSLN